MRVIATVLLCLFILTACGKTYNDISPAMDLRQKLGSGAGCSFSAEITADYGDRIYTFTMDCSADAEGALRFQLVEPETISGISGTVSQDGGKLEFADKVLLFEPLTHGQLTPAVAPWLLIKAVTGGYIRAISTQGDKTVVTIDDTFKSEKLLVILTMQMGNPVYAELFWNDRRILSLNIVDFRDL